MNIDEVVFQINKFWRYPMSVRLRLYGRLADLLDAHVGVVSALREMKSEYEGFGINDRDYKLICDMLPLMEEGKSVTDALSHFIPSNELMIIEAGRSSDNLAGGFRDAAESTKVIFDVRSSILKKMGMPIFLFIMSIVIVVGGNHLCDFYLSVVPIEEWKDLARLFYNFGLNIIYYWPVYLVSLMLVIVLIFFLVVYVPKDEDLLYVYHKVRPVFEKIPPWSIYKLISGYSFLYSFSVLTKNQVATKESLNKLHERSAPYIKDHINRMKDDIEEGFSPGVAITNTNLMDVDSQMSIRIISRTSGFSKAIEQVAQKNIDRLASQLYQAFYLFNILGWVSAAIMFLWFVYTQLSITLSSM